MSNRSEVKKNLAIIIALLFSPVLLLIALKRKRNAQPTKILIIPQATRIGDLISATGAIRAIKQRYPNATLVVLVSGKSQGILEGNTSISRIITYRTKGFYSMLGEVISGRFDVVINFSGTAFGSAFALFALAPMRVKLTRRPRPIIETMTDWLNTHWYKYEQGTYLPRHFGKMLEPIDIQAVDMRPQVFVQEESEGRINDLFSELRISEKALVGVSLSAGNSIKEWGEENFKKLSIALCARYDVEFLWLGGSNDAVRVTAFVAGLPENLQKKSHICTKVALRDLPAFMSRLSLYIAVDTGPIHIAHALSVPLVDIVGPVAPDELVPQGPLCLNILPEGHIPPSVFAFHKNGASEVQRAAIDSIKAEKAFAEISKFIDTNMIFK